MRTVIVAICVAAAGCSSASVGNEQADAAAPASLESAHVGSGDGPCATRRGTYLFSYVTRGGTCGPLGDRITVAGGAPPADAGPSPCTGPGSMASPDNCEISYSSQCPDDGAVKGGALRVTGAAKWSTDGSYGTAIEQWTASGPDGHVLCSGTYDVTMRRQ